jgi:primosomal protein N' (replication factor Y)
MWDSGSRTFERRKRTFQLLTQVAGRAGRGERAGEAIVQTLYPEHYSIQLACRQDYPAFFDREVAYRRAMRYPPFFALINGVVRGRTFDDAMQQAREIVRRLEPATVAGRFTVLGTGTRAARAFARRASGSVLLEGDETGRHAERADAGSCRDAGDSPASDN